MTCRGTLLGLRNKSGSFVTLAAIRLADQNKSLSQKSRV